MILSTAHSAARDAAARAAANEASLALLNDGEQSPVLKIYEGTPEDPGDMLVAISLQDPAASIDQPTQLITLATPIEALAAAAGTAGFAILDDSNGDPFGTLTVSDSEGEGEIKLGSTTIPLGGTVKINTAALQG